MAQVELYDTQTEDMTEIEQYDTYCKLRIWQKWNNTNWTRRNM